MLCISIFKYAENKKAFLYFRQTAGVWIYQCQYSKDKFHISFVLHSLKQNVVHFLLISFSWQLCAPHSNMSSVSLIITSRSLCNLIIFLWSSNSLCWRSGVGRKSCGQNAIRWRCCREYGEIRQSCAISLFCISRGSLAQPYCME